MIIRWWQPGFESLRRSLFVPDGYGLMSVAVAAQRSGDVGERGVPNPGFGARPAISQSNGSGQQG